MHRKCGVSAKYIGEAICNCASPMYFFVQIVPQLGEKWLLLQVEMKN